MSRRLVIVTAAICVAVVGSVEISRAIPPLKGPILVPAASYDERTLVAPSAVPGAGRGLFAKVKIKAGEVIGELGGQLIDKQDLRKPSSYVARLPGCAARETAPYRLIDSQDHGGHVNRINFAPRLINGRETHFQNSAIHAICKSPWVVYVATKDIEPGEEMFVSYGPNYNYAAFMNEPKIRDYFCTRATVDCSRKWVWEH